MSGLYEGGNHEIYDYEQHTRVLDESNPIHKEQLRRAADLQKRFGKTMSDLLDNLTVFAADCRDAYNEVAETVEVSPGVQRVGAPAFYLDMHCALSIMYSACDVVAPLGGKRTVKDTENAAKQLQHEVKMLLEQRRFFEALPIVKVERMLEGLKQQKKELPDDDDE